MSARTPVLFLLLVEDVKVLDVLASLDLRAVNFLVDIFDEATAL